MGMPLLAFYGDDFTGSTDAMEVLANNDLETLLFLRLPGNAEIQAARQRYDALGFAGVSRAKSPDWMDRELPAYYAALKSTGAAICHYKVCSTFDSSPGIGNIGRAIQIGRRVLQAGAVPLIVGAPAMRRYTVFGQLFAGVGEVTYRIDRHPTMSAHPVTPMDEADLRLHLARQAPLRIGLVDVAALARPDAPQRMQAEMQHNDVVLFDVMDAASQARTGELVWSLTEGRPRPCFCVGSSGVEYALAAHWRTLWPERIRPVGHRAQAVDRIAVISGSCSPVTAGQIRHALRHGFADLRADPVALVRDDGHEAETARLLAAAHAALARGLSPLIYTAAGPDDPEVARLNAFLHAQGRDTRDALALMGRRKGLLLQRLLRESGLRRVVVSGGDTSGEVIQALGLNALRMKARLTPGAPLCDAYTDTQAPPVLEIALKGGQMGNEDYFSAARAGHAGIGEHLAPQCADTNQNQRDNPARA